MCRLRLVTTSSNRAVDINLICASEFCVDGDNQSLADQSLVSGSGSLVYIFLALYRVYCQYLSYFDRDPAKRAPSIFF